MSENCIGNLTIEFCYEGGKQLKKLLLSCNEINCFPTDPRPLSWSNINYLSISYNNFDDVPSSIDNLTLLENFDFVGNRFPKRKS